MANSGASNSIPVSSRRAAVILRRKKLWFFLGFIVLVLWLTGVILYQTHKPLPEGISMEGPIHHVTDDDIHFLYDLTYQGKGGATGEGGTIQEQMIFTQIYKAIEEAEQFIVIDEFLYNGYYDKGQSFPPLSRTLTDKLIEQKTKHPNMRIVVNDDEINTSYGSNADSEFALLKAHGISTTHTHMEPFRDSTPLYSAIWRTFLQCFGQSGHGWVPDPMANLAPKMTLRSDLKLLNVKANHRKVVITEKELIVSTANAQDSSFYNSNSGFAVKGNIISDALASEQAAIPLASKLKLPAFVPANKETGDIAVRLVTEGKTLQHVLKSLAATESGDTVWIGMFYLADQQVIDKLLQASARGVKLNLILDPNEVAFGNDKIGLPNRPVASELIDKSQHKIHIRWYNTTEEQYHTKLMLIDKKKQSIIINGSANYTKRNLDDLNLESDLEVTAPTQSQAVQEVRQYFNRLWTNDGAEFTLDYSAHEDKTIYLKKVLNKLESWLGFTTY